MRNIKKYQFVLLLATLVLFHFVNNYLWLKLDTTPPGWDQARHLNLSLDYYNWGKESLSHINGDFVAKFLNISYFYPPFYHLSIVPVYLLFGINNDYAVMVNMFYLAIALLAIYGIGRILYSELTGFLAAFVFSVYQFNLWLFRNCLIETALTAFVALAYYLFLKSAYLQNRKYSILLGITIGIGMLIKWTFLFFVFGIIIFVIGSLIKKKFRDTRLRDRVMSLRANSEAISKEIIVGNEIATVSKGDLAKTERGPVHGNGIIMVNAAICTATASLIDFPWYSWNVINIVTGFNNNMTLAVREGDPAILSIASLLYYVKGLNYQILPVLVVIFVVGLVFFPMRYRKEYNILSLWLLSSFVMIVLVRNKDLRFSAPLLPVIAILSVAWIDLLKNKLKYAAGLFIVVFGLIQFFTYSYVSYSKAFAPISKFGPPVNADWHYKDIFESIKNNMYPEKNFASVTIAVNNEGFHVGSFRLFSRQCNLPLIIKNREEDITNFSDFIVYKTGNQGPAAEDFKNISIIEDKESHFSNLFKSIASYDLPDSSKAILFKRNPDKLTNPEFERKLVSNLIAAIRNYFEYTQDLKIKLVEKSKIESKRGNFKSIEINIKNAVYSGLIIPRLNLKFEDISLDMYELFLKRRIVILGMRNLKPSLEINRDSVIKFCSTVDALKNPELSFEGNTIIFQASYKLTSTIDMPVYIRAAFGLNKDNQELGLDVEKIVLFKYMYIPKFIYNSIFSKRVSLKPVWNWPSYTTINQIKILDNILEIS